MLSSVKSGVSFSHVHCDHGHAYLTCTIWPGKEIMTTAFPLDFFYILVCAFLFVYFTSYCCSCYEGALKKIDQMWSEYHFFIFWRILVRRNFPRIPEKPWDFLEKFCSGTWPDQENTSNIENKSNDNRKATKNSLWGDKNSTVRFFSGKVPFLGTGDGEWGFRRAGRGESNLTCLSPGESHPFKLDKLTTSHPFSPILYHHLLTHPGSTSFFAKFLVYVTSGWKFDRKDQTSLSLKRAFAGSNSIVFQNSIWYINHSFSILLQRPNYFINSVNKTKFLRFTLHHRKHHSFFFLEA